MITPIITLILLSASNIMAAEFTLPEQAKTVEQPKTFDRLTGGLFKKPVLTEKQMNDVRASVQDIYDNGAVDPMHSKNFITGAKRRGNSEVTVFTGKNLHFVEKDGKIYTMEMEDGIVTKIGSPTWKERVGYWALKNTGGVITVGVMTALTFVLMDMITKAQNNQAQAEEDQAVLKLKQASSEVSAGLDDPTFNAMLAGDPNAPGPSGLSASGSNTAGGNIDYSALSAALGPSA